MHVLSFVGGRIGCCVCGGERDAASHGHATRATSATEKSARKRENTRVFGGRCLLLDAHSCQTLSVPGTPVSRLPGSGAGSMLEEEKSREFFMYFAPSRPPVAAFV